METEAMTKEALHKAASYIRDEIKKAQLGGNGLGIVLHDALTKCSEVLDVLAESDDIEKNGDAIGAIIVHLWEGLQDIGREFIGESNKRPVAAKKSEQWATRPGAEQVPPTDTSKVRPQNSSSPIEVIVKDWKLSDAEKAAFDPSDIFGIKHKDNVIILKDRHNVLGKREWPYGEWQQKLGEFANQPVAITILEK